MLKEQLQQQTQQTKQALAQLILVREQLLTETNARIEAQVRLNQVFKKLNGGINRVILLGSYSATSAAKP